jgi:hypothetical protein
MRVKTLIPTNLADGPRVAELPPESKLILGLGLWGGRYTNTVGVASLPIKALSASLSLEPMALEQGIKKLSSLNLLVGDWETLEFFIIDWFRFHTFNGLGREIAAREFLKIESRKIRVAVLKAAPWITATSIALTKRKNTINQTVSIPTAASTPPAATNKTRTRRDSGLVTYYPEDIVAAEKIEKKFDESILQHAIKTIENQRKEAVPGLVEREIEIVTKRANKEKQEKEIAERMASKSTPDVAARGLNMAWAIVRKRSIKELQRSRRAKPS